MHLYQKLRKIMQLHTSMAMRHHHFFHFFSSMRSPRGGVYNLRLGEGKISLKLASLLPRFIINKQTQYYLHLPRICWSPLLSIISKTRIQKCGIGQNHKIPSNNTKCHPTVSLILHKNKKHFLLLKRYTRTTMMKCLKVF